MCNFFYICFVLTLSACPSAEMSYFVLAKKKVYAQEKLDPGATMTLVLVLETRKKILHKNSVFISLIVKKGCKIL